MIGALQGTIFHKGLDHIILMTGGVGYRVAVPLPLLTKLQQSEELSVWIYNHIREDVFDLYGFASLPELKLFELIIGVSGIGPKTALLIMSKGVSEIEQAISRADVSFFTGIPRLGTKNAQKIIIELKNKIGGRDLDLTTATQDQQEVVKALQTLGFEKREIVDKLGSLESGLAIEDQIRKMLKLLGKS